MLEARIMDPSSVDRGTITAILDQGRAPIVQFSRPGFKPDILKQVNRLCAEFGDRIEVRFYGHHENGFDAAVLADLPDVRALAVDGLQSIVNEDEIFKLPLTRLRFGVYRFDDPNFLARLAIGSLSHLALGETAKRNFDLAPLVAGASLERLFVQGHTKNIETIAELPRLRTLVLSCLPNKQGLAFLNGVAPLRSLELLLGGRASIDEFEHGDLEELSILRVRGFESLGAIRRFPRLRTLHIADQLQLRTIDVGGAPLQTLQLINCKTLDRIDGLALLDRLAELRVSRTKLDLDAMLERDWPDTLKVLALYSASSAWNTKARAVLDGRGFREHVSLPPYPSNALVGR